MPQGIKVLFHTWSHTKYVRFVNYEVLFLTNQNEFFKVDAVDRRSLHGTRRYLVYSKCLTWVNGTNGVSWQRPLCMLFLHPGMFSFNVLNRYTCTRTVSFNLVNLVNLFLHTLASCNLHHNIYRICFLYSTFISRLSLYCLNMCVRVFVITCKALYSLHFQLPKVSPCLHALGHSPVPRTEWVTKQREKFSCFPFFVVQASFPTSHLLLNMAIWWSSSQRNVNRSSMCHFPASPFVTPRMWDHPCSFFLPLACGRQ